MDSNILTSASSSTMDFCYTEPANSKMVQDPQIDLEAYMAAYSGHSRTDRLLFIAKVCPTLRQESLIMALDAIKADTLDVEKYKSVVQLLGPDAHNVDHTWIGNAKQKAHDSHARLETELVAYKSSLIKESIRLGLLSLASHYYSTCDLLNAVKTFTKTRDYCTTHQQVLAMCLGVVQCSLELGNYNHMSTYIIKARSNLTDESSVNTENELKVYQALVYLAANNYKMCAQELLSIQVDTFQPLSVLHN